MTHRLPYEAFRKLIAMRGVEMPELPDPCVLPTLLKKRPVSYRRSIVINLQAIFFHPVEYALVRKEEGRILEFAHGETQLEIFLRLARRARFFRISMDSILNNIPSKRQERIESNARAEGSTYRVTRFACNLPTTAPSIVVVPEKFDPVAAQTDHLKKLSDAVDLQALSGNVDPSITAMAHMWPSLDPPRPESPPKGKGLYKQYFYITVRDGV